MNRIDTWTIFVKLLKVCKSLTIEVLQILRYLKKERRIFPNRIGQQSLNVLYKGFNGLPSYCIGMSFFFLMTTTIPSAFMMTLTLYILLAMHEYSLLWSWWLGWCSPYQWKSSLSMNDERTSSMSFLAAETILVGPSMVICDPPLAGGCADCNSVDLFDWGGSCWHREPDGRNGIRWIPVF